MKRVAKIIIIDDKNKYLLLRRANHPTFGTDADLPGGIVEKDESVLEAAIREVAEETGTILDTKDVTELYQGEEYSLYGEVFSLYEAHLPDRPEVTLSWEHGEYEWLDKQAFLEQAKAAKDVYMHMVYDVLS